MSLLTAIPLRRAGTLWTTRPALASISSANFSLQPTSSLLHLRQVRDHDLPARVSDGTMTIPRCLPAENFKCGERRKTSSDSRGWAPRTKRTLARASYLRILSWINVIYHLRAWLTPAILLERKLSVCPSPTSWTPSKWDLISAVKLWTKESSDRQKWMNRKKVVSHPTLAQQSSPQGRTVRRNYARLSSAIWIFTRPLLKRKWIRLRRSTRSAAISIKTAVLNLALIFLAKCRGNRRLHRSKTHHRSSMPSMSLIFQRMPRKKAVSRSSRRHRFVKT